MGNQCEEVIKLLAEETSKDFLDVAEMLLQKRYVDDFGKGIRNHEENQKLKENTANVLSSIGMKIKGWTESGLDPPEEILDNGVSVGFTGLTWFPKGDFYKLNIQSLHFNKKKRGKYPKDVETFEKTEGLTIEEFTPQKIRRSNCIVLYCIVISAKSNIIQL